MIVGGPVSLSLDGTLNVLDPNAIATFSIGDTWDLFDWNTAPTGTFDTLNLPALPGGLLWDSADLYTGGTITIVIPEPASLGLIALAGAATLRRRRR